MMNHIYIAKLATITLTIILGIIVNCQANEKTILYFFWGDGCPHCAKAKPFLEELQKRYSQIEIRSFEVYDKEENLKLLHEMAKKHGVEARGVPMFFIRGHSFSGFSTETAASIEAEVKQAATGFADQKIIDANRLTIPFLGTIDTATLSFPIFTIIIAGLDSFNPCAFFVLFFLLSLLVHAHSRQRMVVIGGIFILSSALVYFLFMAAWLNFFLLFGQLKYITITAGTVALVIATLNIKDFFFFKKVVSLGISEQSKPKLFERMREIMHADSLPTMVIATVVLALAANTYEVVCTAGFPMVYTRALTMQHLPFSEYYLYLVFYNVVYVIPLGCIVSIFAITLGSRKLSEWQGRILKLLSGVMMLGLALVLLMRPSLLNNIVVSLGLLLVTITLTVIVVKLAEWLGLNIDRNERNSSPS